MIAKKKPKPLTYLWFFWVLATAISSCNATPTAPLPPPDGVIDVSDPSDDGMVDVTGEDHVNWLMGQALIFNETEGRGIIVEINDQGGFNAQIAAELNAILTVQLKKDYSLSEELTYIVGPETNLESKTN